MRRIPGQRLLREWPGLLRQHVLQWWPGLLWGAVPATRHRELFQPPGAGRSGSGDHLLHQPRAGALLPAWNNLRSHHPSVRDRVQRDITMQQRAVLRRHQRRLRRDLPGGNLLQQRPLHSDGAVPGWRLLHRRRVRLPRRTNLPERPVRGAVQRADLRRWLLPERLLHPARAPERGGLRHGRAGLRRLPQQPDLRHLRPVRRSMRLHEYGCACCEWRVRQRLHPVVSGRPVLGSGFPALLQFLRQHRRCAQGLLQWRLLRRHGLFLSGRRRPGRQIPATPPAGCAAASATTAAPRRTSSAAGRQPTHAVTSTTSLAAACTAMPTAAARRDSTNRPRSRAPRLPLRLGGCNNRHRFRCCTP